MKPIPFEVGRVVLSKQGRDRGRYFLVVSMIDDDFALLADGDTRKLAKPKRKRIKHLHPKPLLLVEMAEKLRAGQAPTDSDLRKALAEALQDELTLCKEG